jgi:hypothetical protein
MRAIDKQFASVPGPRTFNLQYGTLAFNLLMLSSAPGEGKRNHEEHAAACPRENKETCLLFFIYYSFSEPRPRVLVSSIEWRNVI